VSLSRRAWLLGALGATAAVGLGACAVGDGISGESARRVRAAAAALFPGALAEAAALGAVAAGVDGIAAEAEALLAALAEGEDPVARRDAELAAARVIALGGWLFAPTELALCALLARAGA
jgi:hypothetical protein